MYIYILSIHRYLHIIHIYIYIYIHIYTYIYTHIYSLPLSTTKVPDVKPERTTADSGSQKWQGNHHTWALRASSPNKWKARMWGHQKQPKFFRQVGRATSEIFRNPFFAPKPDTVHVLLAKDSILGEVDPSYDVDFFHANLAGIGCSYYIRCFDKSLGNEHMGMSQIEALFSSLKQTFWGTKTIPKNYPWQG